MTADAKATCGRQGMVIGQFVQYESFPRDEMPQSKMDYPCERRGAAR